MQQIFAHSICSQLVKSRGFSGNFVANARWYVNKAVYNLWIEKVFETNSFHHLFADHFF